MTVSEAWRIVGNQPKWAIRNMVRALSMCNLLNTDADNERLVAAKICLRTNNPRYS